MKTLWTIQCHAPVAISALIISLAITATARGAVPDSPPTFSDPLNINNAFQPFQVGGLKVFTGKEQSARTVVVDQYLAETRTFAWSGMIVECRVLREIAFESGLLVESSDNFFAQGDDGAVYYFGEVVDNYENGVIVNHDGSWLVGGPALATDPPETGAADDPTVFMPADPAVGDVFKPEDLFPLVDETATVVATEAKVKVPAGHYEGAIVIEESSLLSTGTEMKWYVSGVGVVKVQGKTERLQLEASTLVPPGNGAAAANTINAAKAFALFRAH